MIEYSEAPPWPLYHEVLQAAVDVHDGEIPSSALKKLPAPVLEEKDSGGKEKDLKAPPGPKKPKRTPARLMSPDPILPQRQIMITNGRPVVIVYKS